MGTIEAWLLLRKHEHRKAGVSSLLPQYTQHGVGEIAAVGMSCGYVVRKTTYKAMS
jgi:hypothetical protein